MNGKNILCRNTRITFGATFYYKNDIKYFQETLKITLSLYGDKNPMTALCYSHVAVVYASDSDKVIEYLEKAISVAVKFEGASTVKLNRSYFRLRGD